MIIGIVGPIDVDLIKDNFDRTLPQTQKSPIISHLINYLLKEDKQIIAYTASKEISESKVFYGKRMKVCVAKRRKQGEARRCFLPFKKNLVGLMKDHPADLIHSHWTYEYSWAALSTDIPTLVTIRDNPKKLFFQHGNLPYNLLKYLIHKWVLHNAEYLSTNSEYMHKTLRPSIGKKTKVIPNFLPDEVIENTYKGREDQEEEYLITVSNGFANHKNVVTALKAFQSIKNEIDINYHLIGTGMGVGEEAHKYAKKHKMEKGVKFLGRLSYSDTLKEISEAKILVHPSKEESFGMVVLEAMALKTPVVAGMKSGNIPYLLDEGSYGMLTDIESSQAIRDSVIHLLLDNKRRENYSKKAFNLYKEKFTSEKIIKRYMDYYNIVVNKRCN